MKIFILSFFSLCLAKSALYQTSDPGDYDDERKMELASDNSRNKTQCFCFDPELPTLDQPPMARWWKHMLGEMHFAMENPDDYPDWYHNVCAMAYPNIFRMITRDSSDTFTVATECTGGLLSVLIACSMSLGEKKHWNDQFRLMGRELPSDDAWGVIENVVEDEGNSVGDYVQQDLGVETCRKLCLANEKCNSIAYGPFGCHLKDKCVKGKKLNTKHVAMWDVQGEKEERYYTHYLKECNDESYQGAGTARYVQLSTSSADEIHDMMLNAIRASEFCHHCFDESPWPFTMEELKQNFALMTETNGDGFRWLRFEQEMKAGENMSLDSVDEPERLRQQWALEKYKIRWTRALRSEVDFWRPRLDLTGESHTDSEQRDSALPRLKRWVIDGFVKFGYDDFCPYFEQAKSNYESVGLPERKAYKMLNSGSGPFVPRDVVCPDVTNMSIPITNADGLAKYYLKLYDDYDLQVPTNMPVQIPVEELYKSFPANYFDVTHMCNALDHVFDPLVGLKQLLHVTRPGGVVVLRHARNEGVPGGFRVGLHQWAFDVDPETNHFIMWNPELRVDVTDYLQRNQLATQVNTRLVPHPGNGSMETPFVFVDLVK